MTAVRRMFIHGLESSGQGFKGRLLRGIYEDLIAPDFVGSFEDRMAALDPMLRDTGPWILVGSSFGGLMAATWACQHPDQARRLVLLAPALHHPPFAEGRFEPINTPVLHVHGSRDTVVPLDSVRPIAQRCFRSWTLRTVEDDHQLHETVRSMPWLELLRA